MDAKVVQEMVALARKLLVALWTYVTSGEVPAGGSIRPSGPTAQQGPARELHRRTQGFGARWFADEALPMTIRGGGVPLPPTALVPLL